MADVRPFRGLRYGSNVNMAAVICPPYDVISELDRRALLDRDPRNAVRLEAAPGEGEAKYREVAATLDGWIRDGTLVHDAAPALYVYRQDLELGGERRSVTGVVGALRLEPFGDGVLPHERTMAGPKKDRLEVLRATHTNLSPIYAIRRGGGALDDFLGALSDRPTAARAADEAGTLHRLWCITAPAEIEMLRAAHANGPLVIADGHHRYETALAYADEAPDDPDRRAIMCFVVDVDSQDVVVLPYHRAGRVATDRAELGTRLRDRFGAVTVDDAQASLDGSAADHPMVFDLGDESLLVELSSEDVSSRLGDHHSAWRALDVVVLHQIVLPDVLDDEPELAFSRDPDEIGSWVQDGTFTFGALLRPVQASEVVDVAASGERMPQKASYFWPKAATGLVFMSLSS